MKKSEIELDSSVELILVIVGLVLLLILIAGILLNIDNIGAYLKDIMGGLF